MVWAFYEAGHANRRIEMAQDLIIASLGANAEKKTIDQQLSEWRDA